jgi:hypothetical protein
MARLYRPSIPLEVKCRVALAQLGEMFTDEVVLVNSRSFARLLAGKLKELAALLGCEVSDLRLDHDPPLALRKRRGEGKATVYTPDANDPEFLRYRPHGAQFKGSHDVKTRIRGDHGQFSDIVLIKREQRREKKKRGKLSPKVKIKSQSRFGQNKTAWPKRSFPKKVK